MLNVMLYMSGTSYDGLHSHVIEMFFSFGGST